MPSPIERARRHEAKNLGLPEGELAEVNMPIANPGDTDYHQPRETPPKHKSNSGAHPSKKAGKNY